MSDVEEVFDQARKEGRDYITEPEVYRILRSIGVRVPKHAVARNGEEAAEAAERIGFPVVMKLVSPQVVHKTDLGAVKLGISTREEAKEAFEEMVESASAKVENLDVHGALVSETLGGQEMIVGAMKDPQFGPMIMFGLGGIFTEVLQDVSYRLAPVEAVDVREMIDELKGKKLIHGYRGKKGVNQEALTDALVSLSNLLAEHTEIREMDLNPIFGDENGVIVADARMFVE
ncbi:MAG: acetate--CoA ligase family protein [Methanomassiliicoccales archaeon]